MAANKFFAQFTRIKHWISAEDVLLECSDKRYYLKKKIGGHDIYRDDKCIFYIKHGSCFLFKDETINGKGWDVVGSDKSIYSQKLGNFKIVKTDGKLWSKKESWTVYLAEDKIASINTDAENFLFKNCFFTLSSHADKSLNDALISVLMMFYLIETDFTI
jgi:hypothetical protein